jgi:carbon-monoxide dehydrogenase small subunit
MTTTVPIRLLVNGQRYELAVEPRRTLADALREDCRLTGTHLGCEHGVCGACTVLLDGQPARACLVFAVQCEGISVRTVEGLAPDDETLHPVQQAFWDHHGLQCGFCTPGFLMLITGALEENPDASEETLRDVLSSNLCRCTGYQNIVTATLAAAERMRP